jgi:phosphohistidine phosphatase
MHPFSVMDLYVLRHGEAGKRLPAGGKDSERALTVTGVEEVEQVALGLYRLGLKFDFVATSPLKRSFQTAQIMAKILRIKKAKIEEWGQLKPEGSRLDLYRKLSQFKQESSILVVGHEPYLSNLISEIVFGNATKGIDLKKAGMAKIRLTTVQPKAKGELKWLLTPGHLRKLAK